MRVVSLGLTPRTGADICSSTERATLTTNAGVPLATYFTCHSCAYIRRMICTYVRSAFNDVHLYTDLHLQRLFMMCTHIVVCTASSLTADPSQAP